jgi:uncharacterized membrane protein
MDELAERHSRLPAFLIGSVAGLRSATAPAVVAQAARRNRIDLHGSPVSFLGSTAAATLLSLFAIAELVVDKVPSTPKRTEPTGLISRAVLGGLAGAAVAAATRQSSVAGAILGAAGGIAGAFAGYQLRRRLGRALHVPDFAIASLEDAVAVGGARRIVSTL